MADPFTIGAAVYGVTSATPGLGDMAKKYAGAPKALKDEVGSVDAVCKLVQDLALKNEDVPLPEPLCRQLKQNVKLCADVMNKYQDANFVQRMLNVRKAADRLDKVRRAKDSMMNVHEIIGLELQRRQGEDVAAALKELLEYSKDLGAELRTIAAIESETAGTSNIMNISGISAGQTNSQGCSTINHY
jgi:hypothetical protein